MILTSRKSYTVGDSVFTTAKLRKAKVLIDPTTVTFTFRGPTGSPTTYTYGVGTNIQRTSAGIYTCEFPVTVPGYYFYKWQCSGTGIGAAERRVLVRETKF